MRPKSVGYRKVHSMEIILTTHRSPLPGSNLVGAVRPRPLFML